jgi:hypothetical protein
MCQVSKGGWLSKRLRWQGATIPPAGAQGFRIGLCKMLRLFGAQLGKALLISK